MPYRPQPGGEGGGGREVEGGRILVRKHRRRGEGREREQKRRKGRDVVQKKGAEAAGQEGGEGAALYRDKEAEWRRRDNQFQAANWVDWEGRR